MTACAFPCHSAGHGPAPALHGLRRLGWALLVGMTPALALADAAFRDAPLVDAPFIADPSAHVFNDRIYVYGSHDIQAAPADDHPAPQQGKPVRPR